MLDSVLNKIDRLSNYKKDGKEHNCIISQNEAKELKKYIENLKVQLLSTEEAAVTWKMKFEAKENKFSMDYLEDLVD